MTMERESIVSFNSPIIQKNTPIKRLGLSRKRKSSDPVRNLISKIQACGENSPVSSKDSEKDLSKKEVESAVKDSDNSVTNSEINYDEEIELLHKRITEGEEKLRALQSVGNNIVQLEELIELWKNGCKSAFLHFRELLKERQPENIDYKSVLSKLGIWEVMVENFGSDSEISLIDYCQ